MLKVNNSFLPPKYKFSFFYFLLTKEQKMTQKHFFVQTEFEFFFVAQVYFGVRKFF